MTGAPAGSRDHGNVDALIVDRYLESILAAHGRGADLVPTLVDARPDAVVRMAAERLSRDLPRFHPSFRFEEALAARLAEAAARMRLPLAAGGETAVLPLADWPTAVELAALADDDDGPPSPDLRTPVGRPLLIGGALTSAALSLAGAAYVAWRIRHPQTSPMARAVRAIARTRLA